MIDRVAVTEQDLSDLIDGRLSNGRASAVRRALDEDPALVRQHARMVEQDGLLRKLGEDVLLEPVPDALLAILQRAAPCEPESALQPEPGPLRLK